MSESTKPQPSPTETTAPFWRACGEGKLRLRHCPTCRTHHSPSRMVCACGSALTEWSDASGRGRVFSYTIVHRAPDPAFRAETPYVLALIELDEGVKLMSNVVDVAHEDVAVGLPVEAFFEPLPEGLGLPKFRRLNPAGS